ncbi:phosphodiesterase [Falsarthrobacter nasiphocae]|uniref:3',5'-cyclic AMP phosphodiesterase CpdA n=1 Tax=Falsarthrobacter nasiphocae TaxID=189863 RepID=A0AAE3YGU0_9MICC|nr:phosphodiesterase [Falsarthrobacter nasiphocae]MDR6892017.1 3',5'-cyclic AMP phosphodiesterase CpdA [Falsarthrobacter nasiphocae]
MSDTHFTGSGPLYGGVDADEAFERMLDSILESGQRASAMIFTGDLADLGEPAAYQRLRRMVEPVAEKIGARLIWAMGNHDTRSAMREYLRGEEPSEDPVDEVYDVDGLRVVVLDTTVPGHHHGQLDPSQLDWLRGVLSEPAPRGTIIAMHHPPIPVIQPLAQLVELRGQREFADAVRGTDVRSILAGHLHYSSAATCAGIPVSVASSTCYTQDLLAEVDADGVRATRGRDAAQTFNLVHVYDETIVHTVVPAAGGLEVGEPVDSATVVSRLAAAGLVQRD